jgi:hypothetical protein
MEGCIPRANITRGFRECYTTHSSTSSTTGTFRSTVLVCPWLIAWSSVRSVTIPLSLEEPWMATIISVELDNTADQMAQVALISLCGSRLADTATMPIVLFPILYRGDPMW